MHTKDRVLALHIATSCLYVCYVTCYCEGGGEYSIPLVSPRYYFPVCHTIVSRVRPTQKASTYG